MILKEIFCFLGHQRKPKEARKNTAPIPASRQLSTTGIHNHYLR